MSGLPFDIARCPGTAAPLCQQCRRREPGREDWQVTIAPQWSVMGCPYFIPPADYPIASDRTMADYE